MLCFIVATIDTKSFGIFIQTRIGQHGKMFKILKIKTFSDDFKDISKTGRFLRKSKLDELPQLINVLIGDMSFIGPRPDIPGYADVLQDDDRIILKLKPGISGLASLKYRNEETLLEQQLDPTTFNDEVIWPDKVRINCWYAKNSNLQMDLILLYYTALNYNFDAEKFIRDWK